MKHPPPNKTSDNNVLKNQLFVYWCTIKYHN